jgi:hypothetical protein
LRQSTVCLRHARYRAERPVEPPWSSLRVGTVCPLRAPCSGAFRHQQPAWNSPPPHTAACPWHSSRAGGAAHQRRLWRRGCGCGLGCIPSTIGPRLPGPWCCLDPSRRRWGVAAKSLLLNPPPTDALPACARAGEKHILGSPDGNLVSADADGPSPNQRVRSLLPRTAMKKLRIVR